MNEISLDNKLAVDEARRVAQHERVMAQVEGDVNQNLVARGQRVTLQESLAMGEMAQKFQRQALADIADTGREVGRGRVLARVSQVIDYLFYVVYALLAVRLVLALMAARPGAGFVQLVNFLSEPFYAPFSGIVASLTVAGGYTLALPIVVALFVYFLLHLGINGLLRLGAHRKVAI